MSIFVSTTRYERDARSRKINVTPLRCSALLAQCRIYDNRPILSVFNRVSNIPLLARLILKIANRSKKTVHVLEKKNISKNVYSINLDTLLCVITKYILYANRSGQIEINKNQV